MTKKKPKTPPYLQKHKNIPEHLHPPTSIHGASHYSWKDSPESDVEVRIPWLKVGSVARSLVSPLDQVCPVPRSISRVHILFSTSHILLHHPMLLTHSHGTSKHRIPMWKKKWFYASFCLWGIWDRERLFKHPVLCNHSTLSLRATSPSPAWFQALWKTGRNRRQQTLLELFVGSTEGETGSVCDQEKSTE